MGAFARFLTESLLESKKTYVAKYVGNDASRKAVVDKFWNEIRRRVKAPENDIDWWIKKPFEDLEKFVGGFDARNKSRRRAGRYVRKAEEYGAKLLGECQHYELWYVPSHEAAVQLGRFYKGISAKWCISTENPTYFNKFYAHSEFVFAIYDDPANIPVETPDYYEKLAFQIDLSDRDHLYGDDRVWDIKDNDIQYDDDFVPYAPVLEKAVELLAASGMTRQKFQAELIKKLVRDREWLARNVFSGVLSPEYAGDGSVSFACSLDYLADAFYPVDGNGIPFSIISKILKHEYFGSKYDNFGALDLVSKIGIEYDLPAKVTAAFDKKMAKYRLSWKKVLDIHFGRPADGVSGRMRGIVETKFSNTDRSEELEYEMAYFGAAVTGTGDNARKDIMRVLRREVGAESCEYDETEKRYLLRCAFSPHLVKLAVKGYFAAEMNDEHYANALRYVRTGDDGEADPLSIERNKYDEWLDVDFGIVERWLDGFAESVIAAYEKQDDLKGQAFFDFDKDCLDNPKNLKRNGLNEANSVGSEFEQEVADGLNGWLAKNGLDKKFEARRFQSVDESGGSRDEDYSDVIVTEKDSGRSFFVECKSAERANVVSATPVITKNGNIRLDSDCLGESENRALAKAVSDSDGYKEFAGFMRSPCEALGGKTPLEILFSRDGASGELLPKLIKAYNKMVADGKTESDCKSFDLKKLRKSTKNMLAVAVAWRVLDAGRTWDVCMAEIPDMSSLIRSHYSGGKAVSAPYIQFGDKLFMFDKDENPLGLDGVPEFPRELKGLFTVKFTPRFGTGSMYLSPRSEITSEMNSDASFTDRSRWPGSVMKA